MLTIHVVKVEFVEINCRRFRTIIHKIVNCCCASRGSLVKSNVINSETLKACHSAFLQPKRHSSTAGGDVHSADFLVVAVSKRFSLHTIGVESDEKAIEELFIEAKFFALISYVHGTTQLLYCTLDSTQQKIYRVRVGKVFFFWYAFH